MKFESIRKPDGSSVSCCPERGGIITSIKLRGKELLDMDWGTFLNPEVNVKGGIPVMFPLAGGLPDGANIPIGLSALERHGFARKSSGWKCTTDDGVLLEKLSDDEGSRKIFPYQFGLTVSAVLEDNGSCSINQIVYNPDKEQALPVSVGLHPYFRVQREAKKDITFDFFGGQIVKECLERWTSGKSLSVSNPMIACDSPMKVGIPGLGTLTIAPSREYERVWFWSNPDTDYICIEPVMRDGGSIATNPVLVAPLKRVVASMNIKLD